MCITENNLYPSVLKHLWGFVFGNLKSKNPQENHTEVCAQGPMCRVSLSKLDLGSGNLLGIKGLCLYVHLCLSLSVSVVTSCLTQSSGGFFFSFLCIYFVFFSLVQTFSSPYKQPHNGHHSQNRSSFSSVIHRSLKTPPCDCSNPEENFAESNLFWDRGVRPHMCFLSPYIKSLSLTKPD